MVFRQSREKAGAGALVRPARLPARPTC